jgi:2-keto-4-pentenoate hydratase/2-oxohepta-3-ene-1,7-dioic acid hydratase in catechol pathway
VPLADADRYIFGVTVGNDLVDREWLLEDLQWFRAKGADGFGPIGPAIVTGLDINNLAFETRVNGEVRQSSNTNDMVFNCAQIISYTSKLMTLQAGDIIYTGTPEGVISGYPKEKQVWLKPGDKLETTIGNLGTLRFSLT